MFSNFSLTFFIPIFSATELHPIFVVIMIHINKSYSNSRTYQKSRNILIRLLKIFQLTHFIVSKKLFKEKFRWYFISLRQRPNQRTFSSVFLNPTQPTLSKMPRAKKRNGAKKDAKKSLKQEENEVAAAVLPPVISVI
jgi:hypothetical protein